MLGDYQCMSKPVFEKKIFAKKNTDCCPIGGYIQTQSCLRESLLLGLIPESDVLRYKAILTDQERRVLDLCHEDSYIQLYRT